MKVARYLRAFADVGSAFVGRPGESLRALRLLPRAVEGAQRARRWHGDGEASPAPAPAEQNRLRDYAEAHTAGPGIWKWDHYFDVYRRHFEKFVGREVHVAEVGVYAGGSLDMWHAYFGEGCRVYGIDIEPACRQFERERTRIFIGDQAERAFWEAFRREVPVVDILIDDGGHHHRQQIVTLEEMFGHLQPGGVYVCEDITGLYNPFAGYVSGLANQLNGFTAGPQRGSRAEGIQTTVQSIHLYPYVTVIEKASTPVEGFRARKHGTQWQPFL